MVIRQGDIYWADLGVPRGSAPAYRRPVIVVQSDLFNHSQLQTVVVCALFSNLQYARFPGNVIIPTNESGLSHESVANVMQIATLDRTLLVEGDYCGTVSVSLFREIYGGILLVLSSSRR
ncbi:MAG TPA: type II toxin-antitoxin system PemK/MazF family toxin [Chloroflexota bacterium]|jgi:mRNA interferase MazF|nr:type II toxin-antitoxin system PemK/MazF family toxin [Chloroflexota bacterium]